MKLNIYFRFIIDSKIAVERAKEFLNNNYSQINLEYYDNKVNENILEKYQIIKTIQKALQPRVDLPSGGYIIIEPTEALTVIDVNSGSFTRSANSRQTVLWTNCEAALEIARQMKLRNIGGVLVIDFIDMESRRDQFQLLEHFTSAIKDDSARPQIAQLTELGLVELTRKRQGQNIYELFGKKCSTCNGLGHIENLPNSSNVNPELKSSIKKSSKSGNTKSLDIDLIQLSEKQEKIVDKELLNYKNSNKNDENSIQKESDNEKLNISNSKEKKVITIELNNNEKDVYSQLGINPLIKLGKEFLTSNNVVRLKEEHDNEKIVNTNSEKKKKKKVSNTKLKKNISDTDIKDEEDLSKNIDEKNISKLPKIINEQKENEITEDLENSRRKRRRSSASIE